MFLELGLDQGDLKYTPPPPPKKNKWGEMSTPTARKNNIKNKQTYSRFTSYDKGFSGFDRTWGDVARED